MLHPAEVEQPGPSKKAAHPPFVDWTHLQGFSRLTLKRSPEEDLSPIPSRTPLFFSSPGGMCRAGRVGAPRGRRAHGRRRGDAGPTGRRAQQGAGQADQEGRGGEGGVRHRVDRVEPV